ncbi:hypothetical protein K438DRAFT_7260 [Mycena galopus ATCC 62051]|nr:hypothetical protein K438DRAFT_7260 [Mycena galopus ATCC 62051]
MYPPRHLLACFAFGWKDSNSLVFSFLGLQLVRVVLSSRVDFLHLYRTATDRSRNYCYILYCIGIYCASGLIHSA